MIYLKNEIGEVYAYESEQDAAVFASDGLTAMSAAEVTAYTAPPPPQAPERVTMRQARLALHAAGLLQSVEAAIDALPEPPKTTARIEWDYAGEVHRASEFVALLGAAIELDDQALDDLFFVASTL